jgi:hypothetical protein
MIERGGGHSEQYKESPREGKRKHHGPQLAHSPTVTAFTILLRQKVLNQLRHSDTTMPVPPRYPSKSNCFMFSFRLSHNLS